MDALVSQFAQLVKKAEDAERFQKIAKQLVDQNHKLQDAHYQLTNMIGEYILANGPLKVSLMDSCSDDKKVEITIVPTERLGVLEIQASRI